jgi:thiol-disulfide isomerase/thioredoxin/peroxiredoxin
MRILITVLLLLVFGKNISLAEEHPTLPIGAKAPAFSLKGNDGKTYSLASLANTKYLLSYLPATTALLPRLMKNALYSLQKIISKRVGIVAVQPNDPKSIRLDELGYTDMSDTYAEMKLRAKQKKFNFPYLYDGDKQAMAKAYGPATTPHVFIFDKERILRFQGRIDDVEKPTEKPTSFDTRNAIEELLQNKEVTIKTTKVFGCSIKWAEKGDWIEKAKKDWAAEPVSLEMIDDAGIKDLLKNNSDKLRLINVWATWCGPCMIEFPELVDINRMYRGRDFEFISICLDDTSKFVKALKFLQSKQASNKNYLFNMKNKYALIEAVDPKWQGALPYTLIVEPGGKIVYGKQYIIDPAQIKKLIVEHPLIGRYY